MQIKKKICKTNKVLSLHNLCIRRYFYHNNIISIMIIVRYTLGLVKIINRDMIE